MGAQVTQRSDYNEENVVTHIENVYCLAVALSYLSGYKNAILCDV